MNLNNMKILSYGAWLLVVSSFFIVCLVYNSPLNAIATFFNVLVAGTFFLEAWINRSSSSRLKT